MAEDLQSAVARFFPKQAAEWYSAGIHKLISNYNKCVSEQGDYVESRKFSEESNKRRFKALFFYQFYEQCDFTFETSLVRMSINF